MNILGCFYTQGNTILKVREKTVKEMGNQEEGFQTLLPEAGSAAEMNTYRSGSPEMVGAPTCPLERVPVPPEFWWSPLGWRRKLGCISDDTPDPAKTLSCAPLGSLLPGCTLGVGVSSPASTLCHCLLAPTETPGRDSRVCVCQEMGSPFP